MTTTTPDYRDLVKEDRIHSRIFTDPEIFDDEIDKIFHGGWNYVAHSSEVPEPGDYVVRHIGRASVIVSRTQEGDVTVLMNRCRHRGTAICQHQSGNASFLRCPYHGWTYSNDGRLVGVPFPKQYGSSFDKEDFGLTAAPSIATYRGFVFASLKRQPVTLADWLGPHVLGVIDMFVDASPEGEIVVRSGAHKTTFRGNWKYVGMDGYHTNFTHKSVADLVDHAMPGASAGFLGIFSDKSPSLTWALGNGHCRLDTFPSHSDTYGDRLSGSLKSDAAGTQYLEAMQAKWGDRALEIIAKGRDPHLGVWPNLQLIGVQIRVIRPIAPDKTEVTLYPTLLKGVPDEVNEARLRSHEWFYGPSGFGQPDDGELFERNQIGLQAEVDPWLYVGRGLETEVHNDDGTTVGNITDETTQRAQARMWLAQMTGEAPTSGVAVELPKVQAK